MDDAETLHQRAIDAVNVNNHALSLSLLEEARGLTEDVDLLDRIDITSSLGIAETVGSAAAISICEAVLARSASTVTRGLAHSQLGMLNTYKGDHDTAFACFARAIEVLADHPLHAHRVYNNRGLVYLQRGDPVHAGADFTESADLAAVAGDRIGHAKAVFNLGYSHLLRNDFIAAMRGMDAAAGVLAAESPVNRAIAQQDRAEVLVASGRLHEAIEALEEAAAAYGSQKLNRFQAECEFVLARTLLAEDPGRARTVARTAARRFRVHGSDGWALRADAIAAIAEIESGSSARALLASCDELIPRLQQAGSRLEAESLALHAARLAIRRHDLADAAVRLSRVRVTVDSPIATRLLAREVRAELAAAREQPGRALNHARLGLGELHSWQATFGSYDLQTTTVGHGQHLARLGLRAAMADGSPATVFEWSERARALASRVTSLRPPPDPALADDLTRLRVADQNDKALIRELKDRIRAHSWFAAAGTVGEPIDLDAARARLAEEDAALVAHIVLDGAINALAVTGNDAVLVPLGSADVVRGLLDRIAADLDFAAQNRTGDIAAAVRGSLRTDLGALGDLLVRPLLATIGYRRLVLTPSALFAGTPWGCLPGLIGRPLTIPTSATRWLEQVAAPILPPRIAGFVAGPRLQRAEDEVTRAAGSWPTAQILTGDQADTARVGWLATRTDLFHVAGHGQHPGDHPLFSAIELSDGPWFGHDIDLLPRVPDTVVLSACDLGRATVLHGEESVGMSAAWLHAGARTVVSSPALLADELACEVFAAWHRLVADGTAPSDALARVTAETDEIVPLLTFGAGW